MAERERTLEENLHRFVIRARRDGYARDGTPVESSQIEGSTQLEYRDGNFHYTDIYLTGENNFAGQEIVYESGEPKWTMVYYGALNWNGLRKLSESQQGTQSSVPTQDQIYDFLKRILRQSAEFVRFSGMGTLSSSDGDWKYIDRCERDFDDSYGFFGRETIEYKGHRVYQMHYHGGLLKGWD